ncbi:MAG: hypothetical protein P8X60_08290 [Robiginitalea sp.]
MELPKFLLGDNTDFPDAIFIVHMEYPRFVLNLENDELDWLEDISGESEDQLTLEAEQLILEATEFYDREVSRYQD